MSTVEAIQDCELLLVRHAQSEWNAAGRWQGHADPVLSPEGRAQALALADEIAPVLAARPPALLLCSDLQRAAETAQALAGVAGLEPVPEPRLRELDVGAWSGLTEPEIRARDAALLDRFQGGDPAARPGGGETRAEIRQRACDLVRELAAAHPAARLVLVTHLGFIRALQPGVEPDNAGWRLVAAQDAVARRTRD
jgi:probable phosphoglycerate mutase